MLLGTADVLRDTGSDFLPEQPRELDRESPLWVGEARDGSRPQASVQSADQ